MLRRLNWRSKRAKMLPRRGQSEPSSDGRRNLRKMIAPCLPVSGIRRRRLSPVPAASISGGDCFFFFFLSLSAPKKKKNQPFRSQFLFLVVCVNCELVIIKLLDMTGRLILFSVEEIEFISEAPSINRFIFKDLCYCCSLLFQLVQFLSWDTGSSCGVMSGGFLKFYISDVLGAGIWCLIWSHFYLTVKRITRLNRRKLKVPLLMSWSSFEIALHACFSRLNFFSFLEYFSFSRLRYLHIEAKKKKRLWSLAYACQSISRCSVIV